jgi:hypothetical protein
LTGNTGAQGPQGVKGDTGNTGAAGNDGAPGAQGAQGNQGTQGNQGIQGIQGIQGVAGPNLTTSVFGYTTGAGGVITQATSKATTVILNKLAGLITMNAAALAAGAIVTFTVTNSLVTAEDIIIAQHNSGGTIGSYSIVPNTPAAGSFKITVRNNSAASLSEAVVIRFAVIRAASS